jgi:hypothetical protein
MERLNNVSRTSGSEKHTLFFELSTVRMKDENVFGHVTTFRLRPRSVSQ